MSNSSIVLPGCGSDEQRTAARNGSSRTKLASLLALSSATFALSPETEAQIIYSGSLNVNVGFGGGDQATFTIDVPGINGLVINRGFSGPASSQLRFVNAGPKTGATYVRLRTNKPGGFTFVNPANAGQTWNGIGAGPDPVPDNGYIAARRVGLTATTVLGPGSFNNKYAAFQFKDSTAGDADRFGWVQLSATVGSGPGQDPHVTIVDWAFDSTGAQIAMGAVPEPEQTMLAVSGALILGAAGVRAWRAHKKQPTKVAS